MSRGQAGLKSRPDADEIIARLRSLASPEDAAGMARFGIRGAHVLGISIPALRGIAKEVGTDHAVAGALWRSGLHEARILASFVEDPARVTEAQMERWVRGFDSWDLCDQVCSNLFDRTAMARTKAVEWAGRREEFVKRAGFVLMASLAVHDKTAPDRLFEGYLTLVRREATDERNFVKKAVNWALRQIGKRNERLRAKAIATGERIAKVDSRAARWIAADALRELKSVRLQKGRQRA